MWGYWCALRQREPRLDFTCVLPCFDCVLLAASVNSAVQPNNSIQFPLLQVRGGCYTISPRNLRLPFIPCLPPRLLICSPCDSLQGAHDSCKTLYQGADLRCAAPSLSSLILPFDTLLKCTPHHRRLNWSTLALQCSYLQLMLWSW